MYNFPARGAGCACCNPLLQRVSRRLDAYSRRTFIAGLVAVAGTGAAIAQTPPTRTLFARARIFDGKSATLRDGQVLVDAGRITSVDTANNAPPSDATIIDCGNRVLMPGLIDAHWHTLFAA